MYFYEQIFSRGRATGEGMTHFERLFAAKFGGSPPPEVREYTGAVPVTITADGTPLIDYLITGNTVQSGTPTPDNPIIPEGCGELEAISEKAGQYKIPILSANTTTPVYLGQVQTTRQVKKYEFTGNEEWFKGNYAPSGGYQFFTPKPSDIANNPDWLMTHFKKGSGLNGSAFASYLSLYPEASILPENATANDFKAYLAAQYANGTPVTVWYVLATPETAVVNEPLMRIGDYADTVSKAQAGVSIPTNNGSTTVDVDTTVKPSEVYLKYMG